VEYAANREGVVRTARRLIGRLFVMLAVAATFACPTNADELAQARALAEQRDYAQAIPIYDRLQAAEPANSDLAIERARVLGFADRNADAARAYAEVAAAFPARRGDVFESWAWQRLWAGDAVGAAAMFQELIAREPNDTQARLGLAQSMLRSGHERQAVAQFGLVLAADPTSRDARVGLAYAFNWAGEPMGAARQFATLLPSDDEGLKLQAARAYYWAGFPEQARPLLEGSSLPEAQWLRDYRVARELKPYASGSFDWSDDSDGLTILTAGATAGWRRPDGDTIELSLRSQWLDGPDTTEPGNRDYSVNGQQALLSWSGRIGSVDSGHGVVWPMLAAGARDYDGWTTFAWRARARWIPADGLTLSGYAGNGVLETVGAIRNHVDYTEGTLSGDYSIDGRWQVAGDLSQYWIDGGNGRSRADLRLDYLLVPARRLRVGVEGMYFHDSDPTGPDQPDLGYWNPERYSEERLYLRMSGERGHWAWDGRASAGYFQEHDGWGNDSSDLVYAVEGNAAYDFSPALQLHFYAGGSSSGAGLNGGGSGYGRTWAGVSLTGYF
jgi:Flp pilus assembly protein TadD